MDIATAEEILATMEDDTSEYEDVCLIDTETRVISVSEKLKVVGVESDEDVVRRTFRMPWRFGENDLSTFSIRINYLNANGEGDIYTVEDMAKNGDDMTFSWLLSRHATKYRGSIRFVVCMILFDGGEIDKEWNTTLAEFTVLEGLETSRQIEEDNPDVIESILLRLNTLENMGGVSDEQIENAVNAYLTKHPVEAGATAEQAAQIQKNKEDIEELQKNGVGGGITEEKDPTVPAWAKAEKKPSYTAEEVGALPSTYEPPVTSVNGKTGAVALVASDVGALPNTTVIPTVPNALKNPYPLTINGVAYDGSEAKTINIQASGGGESVSLDTTLTQYGMAADAGAVGNALAQEKDAREEALNELKEAIVDEVHVGETEPTDPNVKVWINPEGEATIPGGTVEVDTTLTKSGMAADAKVTGDLLNSLNEEIAKQQQIASLMRELFDMVAYTGDVSIIKQRLDALLESEGGAIVELLEFDVILGNVIWKEDNIKYYYNSTDRAEMNPVCVRYDSRYQHTAKMAQGDYKMELYAMSFNGDETSFLVDGTRHVTWYGTDIAVIKYDYKNGGGQLTIPECDLFYIHLGRTDKAALTDADLAWLRRNFTVERVLA